ncbi:MAG: hypothetical protein F4218_08365 [Synechococcus sp. SB0677_bin_5]|nr:hypothetical protein [Synechococcus sp. SB0677_bin_5]
MTEGPFRRRCCNISPSRLGFPHVCPAGETWGKPSRVGCQAETGAAGPHGQAREEERPPGASQPGGFPQAHCLTAEAG